MQSVAAVQSNRVDVERLVFECVVADDYDGLLQLYRSTIGCDENRAEFYSAFDESAYFLEDAPHKRIAQMARVRIRRLTGGKIKRDLMAQNDGDLCGVTLKNIYRDQYAILLPDASVKGKFRASFFDEFGFSNHITRDNYDAVIDEVLQDGYNVLATGALDEVAKSPKWMNWYNGKAESL